MQPPYQPIDFALKETSPPIVARYFKDDKFPCTYDLVEKMHYLYVHVVKAKNLPTKDVNGCCDSYVEVTVGNYKGVTKIVKDNVNPEWNEVFAYAKERIQSSTLELFVIDKDVVIDNFMGMVQIDLNNIGVVHSPFIDKSWYKLENRLGKIVEGELNLVVWLGTQADEAFSQAWHADAAKVSSEGLANIRQTVYLSSKLWYVRVDVIEAQNLIPTYDTKSQEVYVKAVLGNQVLRTKKSKAETRNPMWNEELMFVAPEPFEEPLVLSVEGRVVANKNVVLGRCVIPLLGLQKWSDSKPLSTRWISLEKALVVDGDNETKVSSMIHLRICLDDGYNLLDESTRHIHDLRPTAEQFWKPGIGVLEVGIMGARGLTPMKTEDDHATTNAYCVATYGQKWVRTRTIVDSITPRWNEPYTWEVFDPCTVITFGVFHNDGVSGGINDLKMGKVKIRLSTLETNRVYTHSYPLILLYTSGAKKMGELHLAIRFTCSSMIKLLYTYSQPLLPKSYYICPLSASQLERLRLQATKIVSMKLSSAEPPLRKEVVEYMINDDSNVWSLRKSKANFFRVMSAISMIIGVGKWFNQICKWSNPSMTILTQIVCILLILYPRLVLPAFFMCLFLVGIWNYPKRPRHPTFLDMRLSQADVTHRDELDEEFDKFPTSRSTDVVRMRYDRLRSIAGRLQKVVGDVGVHGKRLEALVTWKDPVATRLFISLCLIAVIIVSLTPFKYISIFTSFYVLRHPRFRHNLPSKSANYLKRLPGFHDNML